MRLATPVDQWWDLEVAGSGCRRHRWEIHPRMSAYLSRCGEKPRPCCWSDSSEHTRHLRGNFFALSVSSFPPGCDFFGPLANVSVLNGASIKKLRHSATYFIFLPMIPPWYLRSLIVSRPLLRLNFLHSRI